MKRTIFFIYIALIGVFIVCGQSGPVFQINNGNIGVDQIELDSASFSVFNNNRTAANPISKKNLSTWLYAAPIVNYNTNNSMDSVRAIKYDGNFLYICFPTFIMKVNNNPVPSTVWTYSNTQFSTIPIPSVSNSIARFMNMDLRNDTLFVLFNDGAIRPMLLNKNTGNVISNYSFHNTGIFVSLSSVPCIKTVDMKIIGSKIFVYGTIQTTLNHFGMKVFSFDISTGNFNYSYPLFNSYTANNTGFVNDIAFYNKKIYVGGSFGLVDGNFRKSLAVFDENFNLLGDDIPYTVFDNTTELQGIRRLRVYGNLLVTLGVYHSINNAVISGTNVPRFNLNYFNLNTKTILPLETSSLVAQYFICSKVELKLSHLYLYCCASPFVSTNYSSLLYMPPMSYGNHILYPGSNSLSTNSFVTLCAPDNGSMTFTAPIKYHCQVGIPSNLIANTWSYSGTGVTIVPLANGTKAKLILAPGATSGTLSVFGVNSSGLVSETMKLYVNINQKPNVTASFLNSDSITCKTQKIPITFSMNPVSAYTPTWTCPDNTFKYNMNDSTKKYLPGYYKITIKGNNGCFNSDSIYAKLDTLKPNLTLPLSQVYIKCVPDSSLLQGTTTSTGSIIYWRHALSNTIHYQPNYVKTIGNYYMIAKTFYNGCKDSSLYQVKDKSAKPNSKLLSHLYASPLIPIDTITCYTNSVSINAGSDTLNTNIQWRDITSNTFSANPVSINTQGNFKLYVTRSDNGCADSSKIAFVAQNNSIPGLTILNPNQTLNCSVNTVTLNAITTNTAVNLKWISPSTNTLSNPAFVNSTGKYYIHALDPTNGCFKKDSITVIQTNSLLVNAGKDTSVCKNNPVNLGAVALGTLSNITYSWSQGSTSANITTATNITKNFIVTATGPNSCIGFDTVKVFIPADIKDSIVTFQNCDNTQFGSITAFASGGIAPYKYSINNGNSFSTSNTFTNLPFGNYSVWIKDSIGCLKTVSASINGNSNLPTPKFIASTFNFRSDTIVLVDLSDPRPDSVQWQLPSSMTKIGGSMFSPLIHTADTGSFIITLKSFYGTCILSTSKTIRIAPNDSIYATASNLNGLKSVVLYPNPNTGTFTVAIEFYKKQNASIQVWDASPYKHFQQNFQESTLISLPISLTQLTNGTYILRVVGEFDSRNITFIINK